jgi:hypothetical protein
MWIKMLAYMILYGGVGHKHASNWYDVIWMHWYISAYIEEFFGGRVKTFSRTFPKQMFKKIFPTSTMQLIIINVRKNFPDKYLEKHG